MFNIKKKAALFVSVLTLMAVALTGCDSKTLKHTTMYYSMESNPSSIYLRLQADGEYIDSTGLNGTYEINGDIVTFNESYGSVYEKPLIHDQKYLLYFAYDGYDDLVPDTDTFNLVAFDGKRTTLTFKDDGYFEEWIYQEGYMEFNAIGSYERDGDFLKVKIPHADEEDTLMTFAVYEGVIYEVYSSEVSDFTDPEVASMSQINFDDDGEPVNTLAVVMIVGIVLILFGIVIIFIYKLKDNTRTKKSGKIKNAGKNKSKHKK
jgi:hypothetical protein